MSSQPNVQPIAALVNLGKSIINDDTYRIEMAQAEPAYYGIIEKHKFVCPDEYSHDGTWIFSKHDFEYPQELSEAIVEYLTADDAGTDWDESYLADHRTHQQRIKDAKQALHMETATDEELITAATESNWNASQIAHKLDLGDTVAYQTVEKLRTDSLALTHNGIMQTCNLNGHNFRKPYHTYAMTAIRSPEIKTLKLALRAMANLSKTISPICPNCDNKTTFTDIDIDDCITTITFHCDNCDKDIIKQYEELNN